MARSQWIDFDLYTDKDHDEMIAAQEMFRTGTLEAFLEWPKPIGAQS
jgi:hypothetical protein